MLKFNSQKAFSKMLRLEKKWGFDIMEHERNFNSKQRRAYRRADRISLRRFQKSVL